MKKGGRLFTLCKDRATAIG